MIEECGWWLNHHGLSIEKRCRLCGFGPCFYYLQRAKEAKMTDHNQPHTPSLQASDDASARVQKTPNRVTLDSIKAKVADVQYHHPEGMKHMTVCYITMRNGFLVIGESAPADAANFDPELGRQFAYEAALRKVWPLEAYLLREYLADEEASRRQATPGAIL